MRGQRHAPAALYPRKRPLPILQEAGWVPGPFWTGSENLAPTGIRSPDRPTRSQLLYRLSYRAHFKRKDCCEFMRFLRIFGTDGQPTLIMRYCLAQIVKYLRPYACNLTESTVLLQPRRHLLRDRNVRSSSYMKCLVFLSDYKQNRNFWTVLVKIRNFEFHGNACSGRTALESTQTEGWTDGRT